jgi:hypothetical protein
MIINWFAIFLTYFIMPSQFSPKFGNAKEKEKRTFFYFQHKCVGKLIPFNIIPTHKRIKTQFHIFIINILFFNEGYFFDVGVCLSQKRDHWCKYFEIVWVTSLRNWLKANCQFWKKLLGILTTVTIFMKFVSN